MRRLRTFIAIELSGSVLAKAGQAVKLLQTSGAEVNWVDTRNMHLTLKFLGDVPETETPEICRVVADAASKVEPFEIICRGLGAFPKVDAPRAIWIGIEQGKEELIELHAALEKGLHEELGFSKENRRFQPHLTLGRLRHESDPCRQSLSELISGGANFDADLTVVEEVVIFSSFLGRNGPQHEPIGHCSLAE